MTDKLEFLRWIFERPEEEESIWDVWDYRFVGAWKLVNTSFETNTVYYGLNPEAQVMTSLNGEPIFDGREFWQDNDIGYRIAVSDYAFFMNFKEHIITVLDRKKEIIGKVWWVGPQSSHSGVLDTENWKPLGTGAWKAINNAF